MGGNFHTQTLNATLAELGADRDVLHRLPFESMCEAAEWFGNAPINENNLVKIAYGNALRLFPGLPERRGRFAEGARV